MKEEWWATVYTYLCAKTSQNFKTNGFSFSTQNTILSLCMCMCVCVYIVTGAIASRINNVLRATWANRYILLYMMYFGCRFYCNLLCLFKSSCVFSVFGLHFWHAIPITRWLFRCVTHSLQSHFPLVLYLCMHIIHTQRDLNEIKRLFFRSLVRLSMPSGRNLH